MYHAPVFEHLHGAEFVDRELPTVKSPSALTEDKRSRRLQPDQEANDGKKRSERNKQAACQNHIQNAFQGELARRQRRPLDLDREFAAELLSLRKDGFH